MIKKILIPLDGSDLAEAAVPMVREFAEKTGAELVLIHVMVPIMQPMYANGAMPVLIDVEQEDGAEMLGYLHRTAAHLVEAGLKVGVVLERGIDAAGAIVEYAQKNKVDLIAMSSHGRSGLGRLLLGSTADSVAHGTRIPVLLVRPDESPVGEHA